MALTFIKLSHRTRGTLCEDALCAECVAALPEVAKTPHGFDRDGYKLEVRPFYGPRTECTSCDNEDPNPIIPGRCHTCGYPIQNVADAHELAGRDIDNQKLYDCDDCHNSRFDVVASVEADSRADVRRGK